MLPNSQTSKLRVGLLVDDSDLPIDFAIRER